MLADVVEFLPDIQSINPTEQTGFVLWFNTEHQALSVQKQLKVPSVVDSDNDGAHYVIPLKHVDNAMASDFYHRGWSRERNRKFNYYLFTLYNEDSASKIYDVMIAHGYNAILLPNNMQLVVKCLSDSSRDTAIADLKRKLDELDKILPKSMDDYFNKILFNGVVENVEYHKIQEQKFNTDTIKQNKDLIIREILYRYFNKIIRAHLNWTAFLKKFDANKLNNATIQNINLVRDFLYSGAEKYVDAQIENADGAVIKFDYLKTCGEYDDFKNVLRCAEAWRRTNIKKARIEERQIRMSQRWAYKLMMNLNDDYYVVRLGAQAALDYENRVLKHPAEIFYDDDIYEGITWYSVRRGYTPIVTLKVDNDKVVRCYGYENAVPYDSALRAAVRTFMRELDLTIPDNSWNKLIGYINQNGEVYDIDNLPEGFVLNGALNLEGMGLKKLPNMSTVKINGPLLLHGNDLHDLEGAPYSVEYVDASGNPLKSLYGLPREIGGSGKMAGLVLLSGHELTAESFVPMHIKEKLKKGKVLGVDKTVIAEWEKQIERRERGIVYIIGALRDRAQ